MGDATDAVVGALTDQIITAMMPKLKTAMATAAESATPMAKQIIQEDVVPMVLVGLGVGAALAAAIGSWFATRRGR